MSKLNAERFPLLRTGLRAVGLSGEKIDQVIQFIVELLDDREARGPDLGAFRLRDDFLSPAEKSFFLVLRKVVASDGEVLAKIRLGDLFYACRGDYGERVGLRNRVDRKHVDFLVCHPTNFEPWFGVELDDSTHQRSDRKERDVLVDEIFAAANLPLVRIPVRSSYTLAELERIVREATDFRGGTTSGPVQMKPPIIPHPAGLPNATAAAGNIEVVNCASASSPACPKCGELMLLRTARSGANAGNNFWGCRNYPRCRNVLPAAKSSV